MKERPILMTPENAQKVHDGTKTQTRRILKSQPWEGLGHIDGPAFYAPTKVNKRTGEEYPGDDVFGVYDHTGEWGCVCPFGRPGDRLWVREAYARSGCRDNCTHLGCHTLYKGSSAKSLGAYGAVKWTPSIHMPRWACRTVVELTDVRVERLQEITAEDAINEGVRCLGDGTYDRDDFSGCWTNYSRTETTAYWNSPVDSFHSLWESINGKGSWAQNPYVWVLTMRKVVE